MTQDKKPKSSLIYLNLITLIQYILFEKRVLLDL